MPEAAMKSLAQIASPDLYEKIIDRYTTESWEFRNFAHNIVAYLKTPQSEQTLLKMAEFELAQPTDEYDWLLASACIDIAQLGSIAGLEPGRQFITRDPNDPEAVGLSESLLAAALMHGLALPEETE